MRACLMSVAAGALLLLPACSPATAPAVETPVTEAAAIAPVFDEANPPALVETSFEIAGDRVNGIVYVANGPGPHPTVVLLHGLPGNERNLDVAQDLRREGFNVLFFHYRGAWGSEGEFSVSNVIEDVGGATAYVRANAVALRADPARILLVGHSLGGFAVLQGAARDPAITCVAALTPGDLGAMAAMAEGDPAVAAGFAASVDAMDMLDVDGKTMAADVIANKDAYDLRLLAPKMVGKSVLVVVADKDTVTPPAMVMAVAAAYKATPGVKVSGVELSGDHSFSWSRNELSDTVVDWAKGCAGSP
jgi:pimeloyl-ACP methyl ester carboxylesterase